MGSLRLPGREQIVAEGRSSVGVVRGVDSCSTGSGAICPCSGCLASSIKVESASADLSFPTIQVRFLTSTITLISGNC